MSDYRFTITFDSAGALAPSVRLWIDDEQAAGLGTERELVLARDTERSWSAEFSATQAFFLYRIGICAAPGSRWALSFSRAVNDGNEELHYDADELMMPKEWLIGTCESATSRPRLTAVDNASA
jgi:hypothetical protein